ncbi:MAG TPA: hypothetical protein VIF57_07955 [Polyangia bacterium]
MRALLKALGLAPPVLALGLLLGGGSAVAAANKCGCTRNESNNSCSCSKSAKCGCPGDCEPKGCEEKREAQMKKEIEAETKKAAEADRKHKATVASGETRTVSTRTARSDSDNGDNGKAAAPSGPKLSAAQTKQLAKLLDSYLKAHPDARSRNVEELRNQLSLTPN